MNTYAEAQLALEIGQQVHHLGLDRHVERRDRFVADQDARAQREGAGDAHPLPLAAARTGGGSGRDGRGRARPARAARVPGRAGAVAGPGRGGSRTAHRRSADRHPRVERGVRVLAHQLDVAPGPSQLAARAAGAAAGRAGRPRRGGPLVADEHRRQRRLARPGLAHDAEGLARADDEVDAETACTVRRVPNTRVRPGYCLGHRDRLQQQLSPSDRLRAADGLRTGGSG